MEHITFKKSFNSPPIVATFVGGFEIGNESDCRIVAEPVNICATDFYIKVGISFQAQKKFMILISQS